MTAEIRIEIDDVPPSDNSVYRRNPHSMGMFMTPEGKTWKEVVRWKCPKMEVLVCPIEVVIETTFNSNRRQDVQNRVKLTLDAMQGFIYKDDCQINKLTIIKKYGQKKTVILVRPSKIE